MRDILITLIIFGTLPFILRRPFIGIAVWTWIGLMNPHRLCWGFAYNFPFAQIVAIVLLLSIFINNAKNNFKIEWTREMKILLLFTGWMFITTVFAFNPDGAWSQWDKVWKIMFMTFILVLVVQNRQEVHILVWVIVLSLGFYGVKGGIFTITTGGNYMVLGPAKSFIGVRGGIALAMNMVIPLMRYLQLQEKRAWIRYGLTVAMVLTAFSIIGTQSRGGLLGAVAMGGFLLLKSRRRIFYGFLAVVVASMIYSFMPSQWHERMGTIQTYEQDASAMGRINAWHFAYNMAKDRPFVGGGFESFRPWLFDRYAPQPENVHDAHNIFFEVMGEHGFVGFGMFALLMLFTWRSCTHLIKHTKRDPEAKWISDLAAMIQVSLVAYVVGGSFLGLAYFDFYYLLVAIVVLLKMELLKHSNQSPEPISQAKPRVGKYRHRVRLAE